jgi:hypothetical protein
MSALRWAAKSPQHCELSRQQRKLHDKHRSDRSGNRKKRLRKSEGEVFVCHVRSPLIESIERRQIAPPANAQQTQYLTVR